MAILKFPYISVNFKCSHYHFVLVIEKSSAVEVKQFFTEHSNDVFYVVYTSFTNIETNIQEKRKTKIPSMSNIFLLSFIQL